MAQARLSAGKVCRPGRGQHLSGCVGAGTGTVHGVEGRHWDVVARPARRHHRRRRSADQLRAPHQLTIRGRVVGEELDEPDWWAAHHPRRRALASGSLSPTRHWIPATATRVAAGLAWGWRDAVRSRTTAAARSSAAWPPVCGRLAVAASDRRPWPSPPGRLVRGHGGRDGVRRVGQHLVRDHDHRAAWFDRLPALPRAARGRSSVRPGGCVPGPPTRSAGIRWTWRVSQ